MKKVIFLILVLQSLIFNAQVQIGLDIDGDSIGDSYGSSVSISFDGSVVAIGAPFNSSNNSSSGQVKVFKNISGVWTQIGSSLYGDGAADFFGTSISLSSDGTILAVGAPNNNQNGTNSGHVKVFKNVSGTWTQIGLNIEGESAGDLFGTSVSLSSDGVFLAVGAPKNDSNFSDPNKDLGHVRVLENVSGLWTQVGADIDGEEAGDLSGTSVSLSDDGIKVAIGSPFNNSSGLSLLGHSRIYKKIGTGFWSQIGPDLQGIDAGAQSGRRVSLSGNGLVLAVGEPRADNASGGNVKIGVVRIYRDNENSPPIDAFEEELSSPIIGEANNDEFGTSVSLSSDGTILAIGAQYNDENGGNSGHTRIFKETSDGWLQIGIDIDGEYNSDKSGYSVVLSGDGTKVAIGAPDNGGLVSPKGHVRVYDLTSVLSTKDLNLLDFNLYPNPAKEKFTVQLTNCLKTLTIKIYNTLGQLVKESNKMTISTRDFISGIYYVEVFTEKGSVREKIVIE